MEIFFHILSNLDSPKISHNIIILYIHNVFKIKQIRIQQLNPRNQIA